MILSFNIEYRTNWGEEVRISGLFPESIPLHTTDGIYWTAELELEVPQEGMTIHYNYQIERNSYPQGMGQFFEIYFLIRQFQEDIQNQ